MAGGREKDRGREGGRRGQEEGQYKGGDEGGRKKRGGGVSLHTTIRPLRSADTQTLFEDQKVVPFLTPSPQLSH